MASGGEVYTFVVRGLREELLYHLLWNHNHYPAEGMEKTKGEQSYAKWLMMEEKWSFPHGDLEFQ